MELLVMMIDVTVKVPEERVPEFYAMFATWLSGSPDVSPVPIGDPSPEEKAPWTAEDVELARLVWKKFSDPAKGLFSILIDSPETSFSGDELAQRVGIPNGKHGVAGVLAWPGRHSFAVGRTWPWSWSYPDGGNAVYWLTDEVAALFRQARDQ
jgi:hypothetical protein